MHSCKDKTGSLAQKMLGVWCECPVPVHHAARPSIACGFSPAPCCASKGLRGRPSPPSKGMSHPRCHNMEHQRVQNVLTQRRRRAACNFFWPVSFPQEKHSRIRKGKRPRVAHWAGLHRRNFDVVVGGCPTLGIEPFPSRIHGFHSCVDLRRL